MTEPSIQRLRSRVQRGLRFVQFRSGLQRFWSRLSGRQGLYARVVDPIRSATRWPRELSRRWRAFSDDTNFPVAIGLFLFSVLVLLVWHMLAPYFGPDLQVEFFGLTLDILFILIIFSLFEHRRQKAQDIKRQQEIIDDFKKWDSDEAKYRIAGAIRRLNRLGKTDIDFGGLELRGFSFQGHDIKSIRGSTFYDGTWGEMGSRDNVVLENIDFTRVDCRNVIFSKFNPLAGLDFNWDIKFASIKDCSFIESNLSGAIFKGAYLEWTETHPGQLGEWIEDGWGHTGFARTHYPAFSETDLSTTSFAESMFKNADFREARGILQCDFRSAKGLETCLFDDEDTKQAVLSRARERDKGPTECTR